MSKPRIRFHALLRRWTCGDRETVIGFGGSPREAFVNWLAAL